MLRNMMEFHDQAQKALESSDADNKLTWGTIRSQMADVLHALSSMKFEEPSAGEEELVKTYKELHANIKKRFRDLVSFFFCLFVLCVLFFLFLFFVSNIFKIKNI